MKKWHGYAGKILDVDLSIWAIKQQPLDEALVKDYMGGKGFGAKVLFDQLPKQCAPLSPQNI